MACLLNQKNLVFTNSKPEDYDISDVCFIYVEKLNQNNYYAIKIFDENFFEYNFKFDTNIKSDLFSSFGMFYNNGYNFYFISNLDQETDDLRFKSINLYLKNNITMLETFSS
ncbi:hypothetical protein GVAV_002102 [Gurleya vavrai]